MTEQRLRELISIWRRALHTMALENQALTEEQADKLLTSLIYDSRPRKHCGMCASAARYGPCTCE